MSGTISQLVLNSSSDCDACERRAQRNWRMAKAWLFHGLCGSLHNDPARPPLELCDGLQEQHYIVALSVGLPASEVLLDLSTQLINMLEGTKREIDFSRVSELKQIASLEGANKPLSLRL